MTEKTFRGTGSVEARLNEESDDYPNSLLSQKRRSIPHEKVAAFLDDQPLKLEHKRARNREAASRCRKRKLDRIAALETRVAELNETNERLLEITSILRSQVTRLKQAVIEHVTSGCDVSLSPLLDASPQRDSPPLFKPSLIASELKYNVAHCDVIAHAAHSPTRPLRSPPPPLSDSPEVEDVCLNLTVSSCRSPDLKEVVEEEGVYEENGNLVKR